MANVVSCPDPRMLKQLALGQTSIADAEPLLTHIDHCSRCVTLIRTFLNAYTSMLGSSELEISGQGNSQDNLRKVIADRRLAMESARQETMPMEMASSVAQSASEADAHTVAGTEESNPAGDWDLVLAPAEAPDELGRLGPYRVLKELGDGSMGKVYEAEDISLQRRVALKIMKSQLAQSDRARQRFFREARTAASIEHDHIVPIYQVGEDRNIPYIAMQLLRGSNLKDMLIRKGTLKLPLLLRFGIQIAEGLAAAHERGLIHRDIKPSNIWIESQQGGRVKILDFGLARPAQGGTHLTQSGTILGTPAYMSPEQGRGDVLDHRTDLYSLGCVLYRMSTGELPIKGDDTVSTLIALATYDPAPPHDIKADIPPALSRLIMRLLNKDAEKRPASAKAVAMALRKIEKSGA